MKVVSLNQGTEQWLEWRKTGVGASSVMTILGLSPYKTAYIEWGEICGFWDADDLSRNPNVIRGVRFEDEARMKYQSKTGSYYRPICIESELGSPWIASLDGYNQILNEVLEIKCPSPSTWIDIVENKRLSKSFRLYYTQVQYQMFVSGAKKGKLLFYNIETGEMVVFEIEPNIAYQQWLKDEVAAFYHHVILRNPPELDPERDLVTPETAKNINKAEWLEIAYTTVQLMQKEAMLSAELKATKELIKTSQTEFIDHLGNFKQGEIEGVKLAISERKGRVNYEAAYKELSELTGQDVNVETHTGKKSYSYRVAINKKRGQEITTAALSVVKQKLNDEINALKTFSSSDEDSLLNIF
ncbi:hypothetical protein HC723_15715 [Vibrio sp. S11_S32]|uniref:lambda-exonuclease family protein n=1 Tax=Vibrio sp. S11_S32 TaxID=2720225 RepID=UPI001680C9FA|nr:YqaJ viral recombinase family protein [Vibrio sp. S11_S32]MBD1577845.1 hypothetical protein [Vibrio sp. S11_S32]